MPDSEIDNYIEAAKDASTRSRHVVMVLVTASIVAFAAARNSNHAGWMNRRLELAKTALLFCDPNSQQPPKWDSKPAIEVTEKQKQKAISFFKPRYNSCLELRLAVQELEKVTIENSDLIHVPFWGLSFDINDLGIVSSITFVVVLTWLRLSLESELRSVQLTFSQAEKTIADKIGSTESSDLATAYHLLGTYQVLTWVEIHNRIKPKSKEEAPIQLKALFLLAWLVVVVLIVSDIADHLFPFSLEWTDLGGVIDVLIAVVAIYFLKKARPKAPIHFWQHVSLGLYWLPVAVQLVILRDNFANLSFGWSISYGGTISQLGMEFILLVATLLLTLDCLRIAKETNDVWDEAANKIRPIATQPPSTPSQQSAAAAVSKGVGTPA